MQVRMMIKIRLVTVAITLVAVVLVGLVGAAAVVYSGIYNVAATGQHLQITYDLLTVAMRQSVRLRSRDIEPPPLDGQQMLLRGAACFRDKCVQCHGAPGVAQDDIGLAMQPLPGPLMAAREHWRARELYWLTRNGIKMSGMPAWELRLTEEELWSVVAFLQRLPDLNAVQYAEFTTRKAPPAPACGRDLPGAQLPPLMAASAQRGRDAMHQYACSACHDVPGLTGPRTRVGPRLEGFASRALVAGKLPRTTDNIVRWLRHTQQVKPGTAMPELGVTEQDARDMAAYLETLY
jgi:mono/diheme cytochrome c family protein